MNERGEKDAIDSHPGIPAADMSGASLVGASLRRANLAEAILRSANLSESDLQGANLRKANLYCANLAGANLGGSNLGMADLRFACLEQANLCRVNLNRANLLGARLAGARLNDVDLAGAILPDGTQYTAEANLEQFINEKDPAFASTLATVKALDRDDNAAQKPESVPIGYRRLPWKQFIKQTYGSLADDPIDWLPSLLIEIEDRCE